MFSQCFRPLVFTNVAFTMVALDFVLTPMMPAYF